MRRTSRLPLVTPLALLFATACGEDNQVVHDIIAGDDQADAIVADWSLVVAAPVVDAVVPDDAGLDVELAVAATTAIDLTTFSIDLRLDGALVAQDLAPDATGDLTHRLPAAAPGEHTLVIEATGPDGSVRTAERTVLVNSPPPTPVITIAPEAPSTDDRLEVIIAPESLVDASRKDGAALATTYSWRAVDTTVVLSTAAYLDAADTERGATYEVLVQTNDGWAESAAARATVTIANAAPTCAAVLLTPAAAHTDQDLTCRCSGFDDPDGDTDQSRCVFTDLTSGAVLATDGSCTLPASMLEVGMSIGCALTPHDGSTPGAEITTRPESAVLVLNSSPTAPVARLDPTAGNATTELSCLLDTAATDPDGDTITHTIAWTVDGTAHTTTPITTPTTTPATLGAGRDDVVCCHIDASDGKATTASAPVCVTLGNAPPDDVTVFVTVVGGGAATRRSTLECAPQDPTDPDGDTLTYTWAWFADGVAIPGADDATLSAAAFPIDTDVTCSATICDDHAACTAPIGSKTTVTITNAPPIIADVTIVDDGDGEALPGETITCTFEGWDDPDGDPADVSFAWIHIAANGTETVLDEDGAELLVDAGLPVGSTLVCRVTPWNDEAAGTPTTSDPIVVGDPIPVAPTVRVDAPNGPDGTLTCVVATAGEWIPMGATWTWRWSINGVDGPTGTTLAANAVSHCDLVRCWVSITSPGLALTSNTASSLMPLGSDCEDGNACTSAVCLAAGGCQAVPQDGGACDDGDPCSSDEVCDNGECVGTIDTCVEDRLSIQSSTQRPHVAPSPTGGYVAHWFSALTNAGIVRATDADESRTGDEQRTTHPAVTRSFGYAGEHTVTPSGRVGVMHSHDMPAISCNCVGDYTFPVLLRRFAADLQTFDDVVVGTMGVGVSCVGVCYGRIHENRNEVLGFSDEAMSALWAYQHPFARSGIRYRRVAANLAVDAMVVIVAAADMRLMHQWDAAIIPDGSDTFVVAWLGPDGKTVYAQRFADDGSELDADPIVVATLTTVATSVAVTAMPNGRFVVVWDGPGMDAAGTGIAGQRMDDTGSKLGGVFIVPADEAGDQVLGGVAALPGYGFVVTYRDAAAPTAVLAARIFTAGAVGTTPIVLNEASIIGASPPSVTALTTGEWVAAWSDAADTLWTRRYTALGELAPRAAEIRANRATTGTQETPSAAGTTSGHVMVAFASKVFPASSMSTEIVTRVFDPDGVEVRAEGFANSHNYAGAQTTPVVGAGADRFVVAWNSEEEDGSVDGIFARVFDDMGDALGELIAVNTTTDDYQRQPAVAMAADGTWVAAWNAASTVAGSSSDVMVRVFDPDGVGTDELRLNQVTAQPQDDPAVAVVPFADAALVAWQSRLQDGDGLGIFVRRVGFDGEADGPELQVNTTTAGDQKNPTIAVSQTGYTLVCWESAGQGPTTKTAIVCQRLQTATLIPQGAEFLPLARPVDQGLPIVRYQSNGRIAVAFAATGVDSAGQGIQLVRVNDLGVEVVPHVTANRTWASDQIRPWMVPQDDRVFVGWQSNGQDGAEGGVYFRVLSLVP